MLVTSRMINAHAADRYLESQPGNIWQASPLIFSRRSVELAFMSMKRVDQRENVDFSWMDDFLPPNKRREQRLDSVMKSSLMKPGDDEAKASETEETRMLVEEVREKIKDPSFHAALKESDAFDGTAQT